MTQQEKFVSLVVKGQQDGNEANNDLQRGQVMKVRDKAVCAMKLAKVTNWHGTVKTLDSNTEGDGILAVELADDVAVGTWNNGFSDVGDETLIKSEELMNTLATLSEGDDVTFSGTFIKASEGCVTNKGLTKRGKLLKPEFVFRFTAVKAG